MDQLWDFLVSVQEAITKHPGVLPRAIWEVRFTDLEVVVSVDGQRCICAMGNPSRADCWIKVPFSEVDRLMRSPMRALWLKLTGALSTSDDGGALALGRALLELARLEGRLG
jgi:hypothetical protein